MARESFDGRFRPGIDTIKYILIGWLECMFTIKDLQDMLKCAEKLEIPDYCTKPTVDVLYEIAEKLSVLDAEIVSPLVIMDRIRSYLESN